MSDDATIDRLLEEEDALRAIAPHEGALGHNGSDYRNMYDLFLRLVQDAQSLRADPKAFLTPGGQYNDKVINAYAKLMSLAMRGMESLNKMRNSDRMVASILDTSAKEMAQSAAIELGLELKEIIEDVERGEAPETIASSLRSLLYTRIPQIFLKSATKSLNSTKEQYGLLH